MDMRRTGNVEAVVGGAQPTQLAAKLGNTLSQSNEIYDTYSPRNIASVLQHDKARPRGRRRLRASETAMGITAELGLAGENKSGNFPTSAPAEESELTSKNLPKEQGKRLRKTK